jgi:cobalt/nickel transport system permease protein
VLSSFLHEFQETMQVQEFAGLAGLLQRIDPRLKLVSFVALVISAVAVRTLTSLLILSLAIIILCVLSRIPVRFFLLRATIFIPVFAGIITLPLPFITPGNPIARFGSGLFALTVTREGAYKAALFTLRVWVCVAASVLLISTTKFHELIHSMEKLGLPRVLVMMMSVTYRFIFLFVNEAHRMVLAMESRTVKQRRWRDTLRSLASIMATLFIRSYERGERVYFAMTARGYAGTIRSLEQMKLTRRDVYFGMVLLVFCIVVLFTEYAHLGAW